MTAKRSLPGQTMVVVLAAGKGTRMGRSDLVKVCFEIDSVPAINRQLATFKKLGFRKFLVVVGTMAEQVLRTVDRDHPGVLYAFQDRPLGTGHAGRVAADALENLGHEGHVLVTAGDSYIQPEAVEALVDGYVKQQADMALVIVRKQPATAGSVGRVIVGDDGQALDIVETVDLARQTIVDRLQAVLAKGGTLTAQQIRDVIDEHIPEAGKQQTAVGELLALVEQEGRIIPAALAHILDSDRYHIQVGGKRYTAEEVERMCGGVNQSLYLFRSDVFYEGVGMINNDNAQREYYLTDVVRHLSESQDAQAKRMYRLRAIPVDDPEWIQGFNSPNELLAIQDYARRQKLRRRGAAARGPQLKPNQYRTAHQWLEALKARDPDVNGWLRRIYGDHSELHEEKVRELTRVLECYGNRFGFQSKACIVRAPGRVNLMGRHVDHRGGMTNFLAIDRETIAVAGLGEGHLVTAVNAEPEKFPPVVFSVPELIGRYAWSEWMDFVDSNWVRNMLYAAPGDWGHYVKAAMLRLQHRFEDVKVRGLNLALSGNVPIAAGLSSSSTIVVATLQAAIALNEFQLATQQFIDLCGEGEWFVGSRGGAGDHAAIYLGQRAKIAQVSYLPFQVQRFIDAPADYRVVIANSHVKAAKSSEAKHIFNARVAAYNLGQALLRQRCPEIAEAVEYLRDVNPQKLGCASSDIYRMLLKVPARMTRDDFRSLLSTRHGPLIETSYATHTEPEYYRPRGVLLYGIAEIMRSTMCVDLLESGRLDVLGELMRVSHDGDRVSRPGPDGTYEPVEDDCSEAHLRRLIDDLRSENPERVLRAQLYMQPGSYACSTPEIDQMVDIVSAVPGVAGAQIAGAGLGGCVMVLAKEDAVAAVRDALVGAYYEPAGLRPAVLPCIAVEGAGLTEF